LGPRRKSSRAQITRRLIERHGFNIVAVEADWPGKDVTLDMFSWRRRVQNLMPPARRRKAHAEGEAGTIGKTGCFISTYVLRMML
jgi:hypothetical protein